MNSELQNQPTGDEEILATRVSAQDTKKHTIFRDITINGETYQFAPREITFPSSPDYRFSLVLPQNAEPLAPEYAKIKYPSESRPEIILSNDDTTLNFTFQYSTDAIAELETRLTQYQSVLKRLNPGYAFFSERILELEIGLSVACFDLCGSAVDEDIYYFYFFADLPTTPQAEILGTFNCPFNLREKWEPLFWQMLETIKPISGDEIERPQQGEGGTENA